MQDERICPTVAKSNGPLERLSEIGGTASLARPDYLYLAARPAARVLLPAGPEESGICDELITHSMRYSGLTRDSK